MVKGSYAPRRQVAGYAHKGFCFALTALAAATAAFAQSPASPAAPMAAAAPSPVFTIKGFRISGPNPLSEGETQRVLAPFVRQDATLETLQQATAALEAALRSIGYGLHRVALPPQEVGDTVRLEVVTFTLGKIRVEGATTHDEANIRASLPELEEAGTPNFKRLAIQTAIANENPSKEVKVGLRESERPDQIDATVTVQDSRPWNVAVGVSNAGSESSGNDRLTVSASHSNLFNRDHQFVGAYTTSLENAGDVKQLGLSYRAPLYAQGGVIGASYTRSDVVGNFGTFTSTGAGHTWGVSYTKYLPPEGGRRSYVSVGLDDKLFRATQISGVVVGVDRRSRPITVGYTARVESDAAVWGYNAELAFNTKSGSHNDLASYRTEDPRISTVNWKALRGGGYYTAPLAETWLWSARVSLQYSPDVLISGEQFGLGGLGSVRGTDIDRPITGDNGLSANLEVTTPELAPGLRLLGFVDAGWLGNNDANGANKPSSDRIASVGLGLRYVHEPFSVSADYGRLVTGSRVPLAFNSAAPQRGDERFYVSLGVRF